GGQAFGRGLQAGDHRLETVLDGAEGGAGTVDGVERGVHGGDDIVGAFHGGNAQHVVGNYRGGGARGQTWPGCVSTGNFDVTARFQGKFAAGGAVSTGETAGTRTAMRVGTDDIVAIGIREFQLATRGGTAHGNAGSRK